jgi:hypothetical protein
MLHIDDILHKRVKYSDSPINIESGIRVIEVLKTAYPKRGTPRSAIKKL